MKPLLLGKGVFDGINKVAKDVSAIYGSDLECGGFLVEGRGVIQDMWLPRQTVTAAHCNLSKHFRQSYVKAYENGFKLRGIWHSHGSNRTGHSSYDNSCLKNFLHIIRNCNSGFRNWNYRIVDRSTLAVFNMYKGYQITFDSDIADHFESIESVEEKGLEDSLYSLIINRESYNEPDFFKTVRHEKYEVLEAKLDGDMLVKNKSKVLLKDSRQEYDIYNKVECHGKMLKDYLEDDENVIVSKDKIRVGDLEIMMGNVGRASSFKNSVKGFKRLSKKQLANLKKDRILEGEMKGRELRDEKISCLLASEESGRDIEAGNLYKNFLDKYKSYIPFYDRGIGIVKDIQYTDKIMLGMMAVLSGRTDKLSCIDCSWKARLEKIDRLYSKLKKSGKKANAIHSGLLKKIARIISKSVKAGHLKKTAKKICKKMEKAASKKGGKDEVA